MAPHLKKEKVEDDQDKESEENGKEKFFLNFS